MDCPYMKDTNGYYKCILTGDIIIKDCNVKGCSRKYAADKDRGKYYQISLDGDQRFSHCDHVQITIGVTTVRDAFMRSTRFMSVDGCTFTLGDTPIELNDVIYHTFKTLKVYGDYDFYERYW